MELEFKTPLSSASLPLAASSFLELFKDTEFRAADHGHRHPLAIYNVSLTSLRDAFRECFSSLNAYSEIPRGSPTHINAMERLCRDTQALLYAGIEHFDDSLSIVSLFGHLHGDGTADKLRRAWRDTAKDARRFFALQANEIKHQQARLRVIEIEGPAQRILGYFVEGVDEHGALGPSPVVHSGGKTAFSFNRALRQAIAGVFFNSRVIAALLSQQFAVGKLEQGLGTLLEPSRRVSELGNAVFWDEVDATPVVDVNAVFAEISTKKHSFVPPAPGFRIYTHHPGDGVSRAFSLPYAGLPTKPGVHRRARSK